MTLTYNDTSKSAITIGDKIPSTENNKKEMILTITWKDTSNVILSDDVTVTVGESTFIYTQS